MKPVLSIGIIFKNEIRCLERCLKSLDKLRQAVPCELVMGDTGSSDGSREIAEKYADVLFSLPWEDDFSAARNAVMDRCSGEWFLTLDADEWLDGDAGELVQFLRNGDKTVFLCGVTIRNYSTEAMGWMYADFLAVRMVRMSTGLRYTGAIHEHWDQQKLFEPVRALRRTVLHHDGYVCLNDGSREGREKLERNMKLLRKSLEESPEDILLLGQCAESCGKDYEAMLPYIRRGVELIREKRAGWDDDGPNILRLAVHAASKMCLPELKEWTALAEELFPDSICTTVEIQFDAAERAWNDMDCPEVVYRGLRYLKGAADYRAGRFDPRELMQSPINGALPHHETSMRAYIARAQVYVGQPEQALETLGTLDYGTMDEEQVGILLETLLRIHTLSQVDTGPVLQRFWAGLTAPQPAQDAADRRRRGFIAAAAAQFMPGCLAEERSRIERKELVAVPVPSECSSEWAVISSLKAYRYGYTLFKPLLGEAEVGTAAVLMDEEDPEAAARLLAGVERFDELPIRALSQALLRGAVFPLPDHPLNIEEMDSLAARLTQDKDALLAIVKNAVAEDFAGSWQTLAWTRGLVLAAVRCWDWEKGGNLDLAQAFAKVEKAFLPAYYTPEVLREGNLCVLPPMHRFGWHCVQAFASLEAGDAVGCVRCLRAGLTSCGEAKDMVEFLLANMPELQAPPPSPELLAMAEKVRTILEMYPEDDPAVAALKASPAYQKVAYLIEES